LELAEVILLQLDETRADAKTDRALYRGEEWAEERREQKENEENLHASN
jgi:hypothetical protein